VIVLILFMGGIQLLCLGIIGSYLAHIYDEVKRRPPFIVRDILNDPRVCEREDATYGAAADEVAYLPRSGGVAITE